MALKIKTEQEYQSLISQMRERRERGEASPRPESVAAGAVAKKKEHTHEKRKKSETRACQQTRRLACEKKDWR